MMPYILWFDEIGKEHLPIVGGKNANLGEMIRAGIPVPYGFAITTQAYKDFLIKGGIDREIYEIIRQIVGDRKETKAYDEASKAVRELIESTHMPEEIREDIVSAYRSLSERYRSSNLPVAVRSSATAEDLPTASFAGQQETFLNVRTPESLIEKVIKCWSSLFTPRAISYRDKMGFPHEKVLISVGVQKMVNAKAAGVAFTLNPVTGDPSQIVIEANWGLGESIVKGEVTPDRYIVNKVTLEITERNISEKPIEYVFDPEVSETVQKEVPPERRNIPCLSDNEVLKLAQLCKQIERHYGVAQDIEFAIDKDLPFPENVFIVQTRQETVWSTRKREPVIKAKQSVLDYIVEQLLTGRKIEV